MTEVDEPSGLFKKAYAAIDDSDDVAAAIVCLKEIYDVSHVTYHHARTLVRSVDAPFVRTTYPAEWVARNLMRDYVAVDPIVCEGMQRNLPSTGLKWN